MLEASDDEEEPWTPPVMRIMSPADSVLSTDTDAVRVAEPFVPETVSASSIIVSSAGAFQSILEVVSPNMESRKEPPVAAQRTV